MDKEKIVILGASGLIGKSTLYSCLEKYDIIAVDLSCQDIERDLSEEYKNIEFYETDLTVESNVQEFFSYISKNKIVGLVNCIFPRNEKYGTDFMNLDFSDFIENVSLQLGSTFLITQFCVKYF